MSAIAGYSGLNTICLLDLGPERPSMSLGTALTAELSGEYERTTSCYGLNPLNNTTDYLRGFIDGIEGSRGKDPYGLMRFADKGTITDLEHSHTHVYYRKSTRMMHLCIANPRERLLIQKTVETPRIKRAAPGCRDATQSKRLQGPATERIVYIAENKAFSCSQLRTSMF